MWKAIGVLAATGLMSLGAVSLAGAAGSPATPPANDVTVVGVLGSPVKAPPGKFVKAYVYCPTGYYVTGGGVYNGAITVIASSPLPNLRGWFVDGENTYRGKRNFQQRADAVCVKGSTTVTLGTAADGSLLHQAEVESASARSGQ